MSATLFAAIVTLLPQAPLQVEVTPRGKEPFSATWAVATVALDTDFGNAIVKAAHLAQIQFGEPDVVVTDSGTELRGELKQKTLELKVDGKQKRVTAGELATLVVVRDGKALGMPSFDGEWMTSFGPMRLQQRGASVKGDYGFGSSGTIEGKVKNGVLEYSYRSDGGSGAGTWKLEEADDVLLGRYGQNGKDEGFWGAYRKKAVTPDLKPGEVVQGQTKAGLRFFARAPKAHSSGKTWPAICMLHGSNMTSRAYVDTIVGTWPQLAEEFVVVGLDGERISEGSKPGALAFNYTYINFGGPDVGPAWANRQSPALVADSLEQLGKELPVTKWFLGGHSQGGFLTYCLVMYYPQLLAGAFPMSCNLLVQCEPDEFDDKAHSAQHRLAVAVIHGRKDDVVDFDGGAYCHLRLLDGGFPRLRLFAPDNVGHQFAWLPVADAVHWLQQSTTDDDEALLAFAEARAGEKAWRDVGAALQRFDQKKPAAALQGRVDALQKVLAKVAEPPAKKIADAVSKDQSGKWADDFLAFRGEFATAAAAQPVLAAYDSLRQQQKKKGDELFYKARGMEKKEERQAIYREILKTCFATKWYAAVKLWMD
jgi:pimeloyl-ACP methyl ester carboxylesterase